MQIAASTMSTASTHSAVDEQRVQESLRAWVGSQRPDFEGHGHSSAPPPSPPTVTLSDAGKAAQASDVAAAQDGGPIDPMLMFLKALIEALTGRKVQVFNAADLQSSSTALPALQDPNQAPPPAQAQKAGFGVEYDFHASHDQSEQTTFTAQGVVRTTDGQEIKFNVNLVMQRQYHDETNISVRQGDAVRKDPLVVNFNGTSAQLSDQRFAFDLQGDGKTANLAMLAGGSGYLALDKNGDGKINNGTELFGPATGNGFNELASYDQNHNGWIDSADAVYSKLKVWTPSTDGSGSLTSLQDAGVGAIALNATATPFELKGANNVSLGAVRATSVYLSDSGDAGTVQQIDLTA
jgi:hypothetical protein